MDYPINIEIRPYTAISSIGLVRGVIDFNSTLLGHLTTVTFSNYLQVFLQVLQKSLTPLKGLTTF